MRKKLIIIFILVAIPTIVGFISAYIYGRPLLFEVITIVFGLFELIILVTRINNFDRLNRKNLGSIKADKSSDEYVSYKYTQGILIYSALLNIAISYLCFLVYGG